MGAGGKDYESFGASFAKRHQRMDDQVAEMRRIWSGEPPVDGADPVGPSPIQAGGPQILAGAMGPKAIRRAAEWADGIYAFSMNGRPEEIAKMFETAEAAWKDAGRATPPRRVGGFWYSLARDSERRLKEYVEAYLGTFGPDAARAVAKTMTRFDQDAVSESIRGIEAIGCDELMLVPATADIVEVEAVRELL